MVIPQREQRRGGAETIHRSIWRKPACYRGNANLPRSSCVPIGHRNRHAFVADLDHSHFFGRRERRHESHIAVAHQSERRFRSLVEDHEAGQSMPQGSRRPHNSPQPRKKATRGFEGKPHLLRRQHALHRADQQQSLHQVE